MIEISWDLLEMECTRWGRFSYNSTAYLPRDVNVWVWWVTDLWRPSKRISADHRISLGSLFDDNSHLVEVFSTIHTAPSRVAEGFAALAKLCFRESSSLMLTSSYCNTGVCLYPIGNTLWTQMIGSNLPLGALSISSLSCFNACSIFRQ